MARTYENLISEVRNFTQDNLAPYRNEDSFYIEILNRGLQEVGRLRPDALYDLFDANTLNVPVVIESGTPGTNEVLITADFQLEMQFYSPLFSFMVGMAEVQDDEFTDEGRAAMLLTQFRNTILGL